MTTICMREEEGEKFVNGGGLVNYDTAEAVSLGITIYVCFI